MSHPIIHYNGSRLGIQNPKIKITQTINEHVRLQLTGVLSDSHKQEFMNSMDAGEKLAIFFQDDNQKSTLLFKGLISRLRMKSVANVSYLIIEALSYTCQMDEKIERRTFQNKKLTYQKLLEQITGDYKKSHYISQLQQQTLGEFTMQYDETDWEFLKRMASRFGWGLIADPLDESIRFHFGLPNEKSKTELKNFNYSVTHESLPNKSARANAYSYYKVQTTGSRDINLSVGDHVKFRGKELIVKKATSIIRHNDLWHEYWLTSKESMKQELILNRQIQGITIKSKVIGIEEDHVKVFFYEIDKVKPAIADTCTFPYATFYTSEGNTGWYCMPELYDFVDIYFPSMEEKDAIVTHSIRKRSKGGDIIKDPAVKIFMTKYRKAIIFEENEILITGNDDEVVIRLLDDHGIELRSKKDIRVKADGNLTFQAGKTLQITAKEAIGLKCKTSELIMNKDIQITGEKHNIL
ncbi:contractile injection system protein, VgrG/Pvc8 family [Paenibacillus bovis]|uniref:Gp5/Type VI secretion system Vgr protein OB-fold domain-containing protein n=1 Tax=Paenibacillus bovis TaxID=1616788 RepID=A0A172ZB85_9BACL|nr:contractile injection system protein, VgrG/Pvc8 family [Paenibacillus bovis]ANF94904.1 hypothetical protein AR543_01890 [Paenibacillus bovis]